MTAEAIVSQILQASSRSRCGKTRGMSMDGRQASEKTRGMRVDGRQAAEKEEGRAQQGKDASPGTQTQHTTLVVLDELVS